MNKCKNAPKVSIVLGDCTVLFPAQEKIAKEFFQYNNITNMHSFFQPFNTSW